MNKASESSSMKHQAIAAITVLIVLTSILLMALFTQTAPHPPLEINLFALGPFLGASLSIGVAAVLLIRQDAHSARVVVLVFVITAFITFGPQKYFDQAFGRIWPAVITAQVAILMALRWLVYGYRKKGT
ncbi:hypothetical protein [Sedimenticola sp.]|uniref:hypothetical protein n=1 Tax=Sedimenticola sp. TaxID=1940285 RepID=UPI003D1180EE